MTTLELAHENYLRPNGHGGYIVRQSDLSSWSRCQLQKFYQDRANANPEAPQGNALSATTYGSIVHLALQHLEQWINEGRETALDDALRMFEHYWQPANMEQLGYRIDTWLPRQTYGGLLDRGRITIRAYYELQRKADTKLLALEYQFAVPLEINGRLHTFTGTIDRFEVAKYNRKPVVQVTDFKTGVKQTYLRHHAQFHGYALATTLPEFWHGWADSGMGELDTFDDETIGALERSFSSWGYRLHSGTHGEQPLASRRGMWVDLQDVKFCNAGWRNERDYARFILAVDGYIRGQEAAAYAPTIKGDVCTFCPFRDSCGGIGLPDERDGAP